MMGERQGRQKRLDPNPVLPDLLLVWLEELHSEDGSVIAASLPSAIRALPGVAFSLRFKPGFAHWSAKSRCVPARSPAASAQLFQLANNSAELSQMGATALGTVGQPQREGVAALQVFFGSVENDRGRSASLPLLRSADLRRDGLRLAAWLSRYAAALNSKSNGTRAPATRSYR